MTWNWLGVGKGRGRDADRGRDPMLYDVPVERQAQDRDRSGLPRFKESAGGIGRRGRGSELDLARRNLRGAFTPAQPVTDLRHFAGRRDLLTSLIRAIEDQHLHVVLYGDRGVGKTSMLHVVAELAKEARYIVRYTSCGEDTDFDSVFRAIAANIPLRFHGDFDPNSDAAEQGGVIADLLPKGPITPTRMTDIFEKLSGTRILVILDEFDRARSEVFRKAIAELIKNLSDRSIQVQLLIGGVASNLNELIRHIPSIRRNIIGIPVRAMDASDVREHVRIGAAISGIAFQADAIDAIADIANGSPYLTGLIGQHAGIAALDREALAVGRSDVAIAVERAADEIRLRISPASLHAIGRAVQGRMEREIAMLAGEAMANGGIIETAAATITAAGREGGRAGLLRTLDADMHLLEPVEDHPAGAYRFREDGVAAYLWMTAQANLGDRFVRRDR